MLKPNLILTLIRRVIFLIVGLIAFGITAPIPIINIVSLPLFPFTVTWLNYKWKKVVNKSPKKLWNISYIAEGLIASVITIIAIALIVIPVGASGATITTQLGHQLTITFFVLVAILYGLIGFLESINLNPFKRKKVTESKQPNPLPTNPQTPPLSKSESPSVDQELYRLKQNIQAKDGYLSQTKPEPKDRKRKT